MRHGRRADLIFAESLLHLADLGALHHADLNTDLVQRGRHVSEKHDILGMAVALNQLIRDIDGGEVEIFHHRNHNRMTVLTHGRLRSDSAGHLSHGDAGAQFLKSLDVSGNLRRPNRKAQTVGGRHSDLTVCPACADEFFVLLGFLEENFEEFLQFRLDNRKTVPHLKTCRGIKDIV